jgi:hypothetical protein
MHTRTQEKEPATPNQTLLVLLAQTGDRTALEQLLRDAYAPLRAYITRLVGVAFADDILQETLRFRSSGSSRSCASPPSSAPGPSGSLRVLPFRISNTPAAGNPSTKHHLNTSLPSTPVSVAPTFGETYHKPYRGTGSPLTLEDMVFATPQGEISMNFITAKGAGFTNFALIPYANHKDRADASFAGAEKWAAKLPVPVYAIDDQTAIKVTNDTVEVVSEGRWKLFTS